MPANLQLSKLPESSASWRKMIPFNSLGDGRDRCCQLKNRTHRSTTVECLRVLGRRFLITLSARGITKSSALRRLAHFVDTVQEIWSQKWSWVVRRTIVISTCLLAVVRYELHCEVGALVIATLFSSKLPKISSADVDKLDFDGFPLEIQGRVLGFLRYEQVFQLKSISRNVKALAESGKFQASPSRKTPTLTACYFFIENELWQWAGFDAAAKEWRLLPPLQFLPANCKPDPDLFKEFLLCAKDGLVCVNFSKSAEREMLVVFNPLSGNCRELPSLHHRRNPVMMHMLVDPATQSFQVIVAGSSRSGDEDLSRVTEVFNSCTGTWTQTGDLLGPVFALNEYQSGVYHNGILFCIGFMEDADQTGKGIIGYDVKEGEWSSKWMHLLPFCMSSTILQLVESNGEVYLFSEREIGRSTQHWVDRLEWTTLANGDEVKNTCELINVVKKEKLGGRSLEVYPEYVCVPYGEGQLCILNAIDHTGVVYDVRDQGQSEFLLEALPEKGFRGDLGFFCLNPMSFTVEPRFSSRVYDPDGGAGERDYERRGL